MRQQGDEVRRHRVVDAVIGHKVPAPRFKPVSRQALCRRVDEGPFDRLVIERLATGHEGLGITTSLATAKLLVDQILGRRSAIPIEPYLPSRSSREHVYA